ncbi:hypothetical protein [Yoonia sp. BS5-3]|uniref:Uncharacterized protein n=1 Tax=Yoonia phaeophyticola TaxID=3137369 RepID=A0ABZ2V2W8_9RHOB
MTRFSKTASAALLMLSIAPAAQAYGTDPEADALRNIVQLSFELPQEAALDGTCQIKVTPELASVLGLPGDWRGGDAAESTALACNEG